MEDIFENARSCISRNVIELLFSSPGSYWRKNQFITRSPMNPNENLEGFEIEETGLWFDFRTDEGGDLIDLISMSNDIPKLEAAKIIIKEGNGVIPEKNKHSNKKKELPHYKKFDYTDKNILHKIKDYVRQDWQTKLNGIVEKVYIYKDGKGKGYFCTVRFIKDEKKSIKPIYMGKNGKFYNKAPQGIEEYLPYNIEKLKNNNLPVLVVEGEKCADCKVKGYVLLSSYNAKKTNWDCIKDRDVLIWPDFDYKKDDFGNYLPVEKQPGYIKALKYKELLPHAEMLNVYGRFKPGNKKDGWDIADAIEDKLDIIELIKNIGITGGIEVNIDPYSVYLKFIDMQYNKNGLEQINGIFWNYDDIEYYWKKIKKTDLTVHFQKWIFETKLIEMIHVAKKGKPTTFISDSLSYVYRHTSNYFTKNPFKDSAISPYIHHKDGAIEISENDINFISRNDKKPNFFKKLYPIFCFDYGLSEKRFNNFVLEKDCPTFNYFLNGLVPNTIKGDLREKELEVTKNYIAQIFAYALSPLKYDAFVFNIAGNQHTGKTFFMDIIKEFIGHDFILERSMESMENRFATYDLWGSKVFIESDITADKIIPGEFVRKHAGEIRGVTVEQKHEDPIKGVKLSIAMFFVSNYQIKFGSKIEGIERRLCPIPFKNKLYKKDKSLLNKILGKVRKGKESGDFEGKMFNELPGILAFALHGWQDFAKNNYQFVFPSWVKEEKEIWKMESNTIIKYMTVRYKIPNEEDRIDRLRLYENYVDWCKEEGHGSPFGRNNFYKELRNIDYVEEIGMGNSRAFKINMPTEEELQKNLNKEYEDEIPF